MPTDYALFKKLSELGKELVELHLLKHPSLSETGVGFPESGSNKVEKVKYDEANERVYFNKEQYFEGISKDMWEYRIGAYQVMEHYRDIQRGAHELKGRIRMHHCGNDLSRSFRLSSSSASSEAYHLFFLVYT